MRQCLCVHLHMLKPDISCGLHGATPARLTLLPAPPTLPAPQSLSILPQVLACEYGHLPIVEALVAEETRSPPHHQTPATAARCSIPHHTTFGPWIGVCRRIQFLAAGPTVTIPDKAAMFWPRGGSIRELCFRLCLLGLRLDCAAFPAALTGWGPRGPHLGVTGH